MTSLEDRRVRRAAVALAVLLLCMAILGGLASVFEEPALQAFHLDHERGVAAFLSSALLIGASTVLLVALRRRHGLGWRTTALPLLLVLMACDEWQAWHEHLETTLKVPWQLLYAPLVLAGAIAWLVVLRRWGPRTPQGLLLLMGAASWLASQVLEAVQWDLGIDVPGGSYAYFMIPEELLEAGGSACFLLAGVVVLCGPRSSSQPHARVQPRRRPVTTQVQVLPGLR